jgi:peptidoglycan/LPS O-acetylase OafA/YrhL
MPKIFGMYLNPGILAHFGQPAFILYKLPLFVLGMVLACTGLGKFDYKSIILTLLIVIQFQAKLTSLLISFIIIFMFLDAFKPYVNKKMYKILLLARNILSNKMALFGGNISYSVYLLHMIIMPFVFKITFQYLPLFSDKKYVLVLFSLILYILLVVLVSYFSYILIEKRFIRIGKQVADKI